MCGGGREGGRVTLLGAVVQRAQVCVLRVGVKGNLKPQICLGGSAFLPRAYERALQLFELGGTLNWGRTPCPPPPCFAGIRQSLL